jgi:RNA polymerase sigma-70 factor (ECF subfamily)
MRRHFRDDKATEVVVERRDGNRRGAAERRLAAGPPSADRRAIRNVDGRRVADRRATAVIVDAPVELPRRARQHVAQLVFVERIEPSTQQLEDHDTARLVMRIQSGDRDAFGDLYLRYFDRVYAYLRVVFRNEHQAEDTTQQVFAKVLEAIGRYERRGQPFSSWLFVVVRNHALSEIERQRRDDLVDPADFGHKNHVDTGGEDELLADLDWISDRELVMFIERLPLAQRQVLVLRFMLDLPYTQIAQAMGRSETDVRMLQSRALRFLRQRLAAVGRGPLTKERPARMRSPVRALRVVRNRRFALIA